MNFALLQHPAASPKPMVIGRDHVTILGQRHPKMATSYIVPHKQGLVVLVLVRHSIPYSVY
jgi:hypothetical protein